MLYALLKNNIVVAVETLSDEQLTPELMSQYSNVIDITNDNPTPVVGWVFNGSQILPPAGSAPVAATRRITKLGLRNRFTINEKMAIQVLMNTTSNPYSFALQAWVSDFNVSTYIDLNRPETIAGIGFLEQITIIGVGRANQILNNNITEEERYRE